VLSLATHPFAFPFTDVLNGVIAMDSAEACKKDHYCLCKNPKRNPSSVSHCTHARTRAHTHTNNLISNNIYKIMADHTCGQRKRNEKLAQNFDEKTLGEEHLEE